MLPAPMLCGRSVFHRRSGVSPLGIARDDGIEHGGVESKAFASGVHQRVHCSHDMEGRHGEVSRVCTQHAGWQQDRDGAVGRRVGAQQRHQIAATGDNRIEDQGDGASRRGRAPKHPRSSSDQERGALDARCLGDTASQCLRVDRKTADLVWSQERITAMILGAFSDQAPIDLDDLAHAAVAVTGRARWPRRRWRLLRQDAISK